MIASTAQPTPADLSKLARRIGPAAFGPRRERRFPYKAESTDEQQAINADLDAVLREVQGLIVSLVYRRFAGLSPLDRDAVIQDVRVHIWRHAAGYFDAHRGSRLSTYLRRCIVNHCATHARTLMRQANRRRLPIDVAADAGHVVAPAGTFDRKIEQLASLVQFSPERFMRRRHAEVLRLLTAHPNMSRTELAARLGLKCQSSLSTLIKQIRAAVAEIDIDGIDLAEVQLAA